MKTQTASLLSALFLFFNLVSCRSEEIKTYEVPRENRHEGEAAAKMKNMLDFAPGETEGFKAAAMQPNLPLNGSLPDAETFEKIHGFKMREGLAPQKESIGDQATTGEKGTGGGVHTSSGSPHGSFKKRNIAKPVWATPDGWQEKAATTLRVGNFELIGHNSHKAQVSVVPLAGKGGGEIANINMWRDQLGLPPLTEPEAQALIRPLIFPAGEFALIDLPGRDPLIAGTLKQRIIAAIHSRGDVTWFFKLAGEDETVVSAKPGFIEFLSSVKFNDQ